MQLRHSELATGKGIGCSTYAGFLFVKFVLKIIIK